MRAQTTVTEDALRDDLRTTLGELDPTILAATARALDGARDRLVGGSWGVDDGDGCLLTLAAGELGADSGEDLLRSSVAAVRLPALFDELWASILRRTGDADAARSVVHRLVAEALARQPEMVGDRVSDGAPETALSARPR